MERSCCTVSMTSSIPVPTRRRACLPGAGPSRQPADRTNPAVRPCAPDHVCGVSIFGDRRSGRDEAGDSDRGGRSLHRRRAHLRGSRQREVDGRPGACVAAAEDVGRGGMPLWLRPGGRGRPLHRMPRAQGERCAEDPLGSGSGGRPAARRDRGSGGRCARPRTGPGAGSEGLRAGPAGAGAPRISLYRRGQPAGGLPRRSAARRRRRPARIVVEREGLEHPSPRTLRSGRQRQSGRGRAAAAIA